jgi:hypothetical protein
VSVPRQDLRAVQRVSVPRGSAITAILTIPASTLMLVGPDGKLALLSGRYGLSVGGVSPSWRTAYTADQTVPEPLLAAFDVDT